MANTIKFKDFFEKSIECFVSMRNEKGRYFQKIFENDNKLRNTDPSNASRYFNGEAQLPKKHCAYIILEQERISDTFLELIKDPRSFSDPLFGDFLKNIIQDYATSDQQKLLFGKVFSFEQGDTAFTIANRMMEKKDKSEWAKCMSKILLISAINELSTTSSETETNGISGTGEDNKNNKDEPSAVSCLYKGSNTTLEGMNETAFLKEVLSGSEETVLNIGIMARQGSDILKLFYDNSFDLLENGSIVRLVMSSISDKNRLIWNKYDCDFDEIDSYINILEHLIHLQSIYNNLHVEICDIPILHKTIWASKYAPSTTNEPDFYVLTKPYFYSTNTNIHRTYPVPVSIFRDKHTTTPFISEFEDIWATNLSYKSQNLTLYLSCLQLDIELQISFEHLDEKEQEIRKIQQIYLFGKLLPIETVQSILDNSIQHPKTKKWKPYNYIISDEIKETIVYRQSIQNIRQRLLDVYETFYKLQDDETSCRDAIARVDGLISFLRMIDENIKKAINWDEKSLLDALDLTRTELVNFLGNCFTRDQQNLMRITETLWQSP
ncbi:MAG: hypothetical protein Q4C76_01440 [Bacillota bacterium]|nr:hypothetical protein [Bacillota bacterium]